MTRVNFPVYLISDRHQTGGRPLGLLVQQALKAGVRAVQLREKDLTTRPLLVLAEELRSLAQESGASLFINGRVDLVLALGVNGVHLPSDGLPVGVARRLLGPKPLIGVSTHSVAEAVQAEGEGADFAVLGPIYETPSKRLYGPPIGLASLEEAAERCRIPVFAIGGITPHRAREVRRVGAFGVAVISSVLGAASVEAATRELISAVTTSTVVKEAPSPTP